MSPKQVIRRLSIALVTTLASASLAGQSKLVSPQNGTAPKNLEQQKNLPPGLKNMPLILNTKKIDFTKIKERKIESIDLDKMFGPGSGGGGNMCALNLTRASNFFLENLDKVPNLSKSQKGLLADKISSVIFIQGANLELRGQAVNAINYKAYNTIVVDEKFCASLEEETATAYSTLLHEYLGVAGIDDTSFQISGPFTRGLNDLIANTPNEKRMMRAAIKEFLKRANDPKTDLGKKFLVLQGKSINGRNHEGSIEFPITEDKLQIVRTGGMDIQAVWHYAAIERGHCVGTSEEAKFRILYSYWTNMRGGFYFDTIPFEVTAQRVLSMKILKAYPEMACEDIMQSESYHKVYGPTVEKTVVTDIAHIPKEE